MGLFSPAIMILGRVLIIMSLIMLLPLVLAIWHDSSNIYAFLVSAGCTAAIGVVCIAISPKEIARLSVRQMFMMTAINWLVVTTVASFPLILGEPHLSLVDALFEATSGITTTGSTVIVGLDQWPHDLLLWRSLVQWLGGLGIIGMAVFLFPFLRIGGMRLFQTESSDWTEISAAKVRRVAYDVVLSYLILSGLAFGCYRLLGMNWFNAINHAFTTISTGGYSTADNSFAQFHSQSLMWASIVFMLAGSTPFVLYMQSVRQHRYNLLRDQQVRGFLKFVLIICVGLTAYRLLFTDANDVLSVFTSTSFNLISVITTTGYTTEDYTLWGSAPLIIIFCAMFVGGCAGSTAGGIKIFRFQLLALLFSEHLGKAMHPVATIKRHYNRRAVSDEILVSLIFYLSTVTTSLIVIAVGLAMTGIDPITSISGALTALMNVGPGIGDVVGPVGNFSSLNSAAKLLLCFAMLLGRLEFLSLIVLLTRGYWKW